MPLTCSCSGYDAEWWYYSPEDYSAMPLRSRRCRCSSCRKLIEPGATVAAFKRSRGPCSDVEENIYGAGEDSVPLASWYLCERCADLYFSLFELGYECISPDENVIDLVKEYAEIQRENRHA